LEYGFFYVIGSENMRTLYFAYSFLKLNQLKCVQIKELLKENTFSDVRYKSIRELVTKVSAKIKSIERLEKQKVD